MLSKPKTVLTAPREAHQLGFKEFSFDKEARGQQTWATAARRHRTKGEGKPGGARDAANSLLKFLKPRTGATQPPPAASPRPTETAGDSWVHTPQQQYINTERLAFDGVTPVERQK